ncbi:hypothetical protein GS887_28115 [Rhodococcus hoagii]|nr:hypothetical protein [Prescottella equi]
MLWRRPPHGAGEAADIRGDRASLPDTLHDAGELIVQVFVDDPWITITRPIAPDRDALRVAQPGWMRDESPALDALARFLAGQLHVPLMREAVSGAWSALAVLPWMRRMRRASASAVV